MTGMEIVREETRRMLRGMIPLAVIAFGVFLLAGADPARSAVSLLLGTCYSLLLFRMIGKSAAPAQGTRIVRRGYFFRYLLTGVMVFLAIKLPFLHPLAAVVPLFFPKIILLWSMYSKGKGGRR